jgi:hypothetical protein
MRASVRPWVGMHGQHTPPPCAATPAQNVKQPRFANRPTVCLAAVWGGGGEQQYNLAAAGPADATCWQEGRRLHMPWRWQVRRRSQRTQWRPPSRSTAYYGPVHKHQSSVIIVSVSALSGDSAARAKGGAHNSCCWLAALLAGPPPCIPAPCLEAVDSPKTKSTNAACACVFCGQCRHAKG